MAATGANAPSAMVRCLTLKILSRRQPPCWSIAWNNSLKKRAKQDFILLTKQPRPALMKALALEIISRNLSVTWWTNVRFEKSFTRDFCLLLKASGCIAVSGGFRGGIEQIAKTDK